MRITIDIDPALLEEIKSITGIDDPAAAIRQAVICFVEAARKRTAFKCGKTDYAFSNDDL